MNTTLTIRTDSSLREALAKRARAQGKTVSDVVREILEEALSEHPLAVKTGHLKGQLDLPSEPSDPWQGQIRARNWRS